MSARRRPMDCRIERLPDRVLFEFVAFSTAARSPLATAWTVAPGSVDLAADGSPRRLHFAPGRWLLPDPGTQAHALLDAAVESGLGARIDVTGKWVAMVLAGADAGRVLASTLDIAAVLANRACAAVTLFDCPAVAWQDGARYRLWVAASHAQSFATAVARASR